jgi:integrase
VIYDRLKNLRKCAICGAQDILKVSLVSRRVVTMWSPGLENGQLSTETARSVKLSKRVADAASPEAARYELWDSALPGFGLRVSPAGTKTFILRYRPRRAGRSAPKRFMTLGRYGPVTVEEARDRARAILGAVADGRDPAATLAESRGAVTVEEAAVRFLADHVAIKRKPNTAAAYRHAFARHIIPRLGKIALHDMTNADVAKLHNAMRGTPYLANYTVAALGSLYAWAGRSGLVPEEFNPTKRIEKFRESRRERFLTSEELQRLGSALREAETTGIPYEVDETRPTSKHAPRPEKRITVVSPFAVAAIRLLLFTGCRLREVLDLRWEHVDFERGVLLLPDSKTGRKTVLLGAPALRVLADLLRVGPYVIAGAASEKARTGLKRPWAAIRRRANLPGVRIHDLRHSYASVGAGAGLGLPIIGRLLGHTQASTTARYAHLADDPLRRASETISGRIAAAMGDAPDATAEGPRKP